MCQWLGDSALSHANVWVDCFAINQHKERGIASSFTSTMRGGGTPSTLRGATLRPSLSGATSAVCNDEAVIITGPGARGAGGVARFSDVGDVDESSRGKWQ